MYKELMTRDISYDGSRIFFYKIKTIVDEVNKSETLLTGGEGA